MTINDNYIRQLVSIILKNKNTLRFKNQWLSFVFAHKGQLVAG